MANTQLKFFKVASLPTTGVIGGIYFETAHNTINIYTANGWEKYAGKLESADWDADKKKLTLKKYDGSSVELDFSDMASATAIAAKLGSYGDAAGNEATSSIHARINAAFEQINTKLNSADQVVKSVDTTVDAGVKLTHGVDGKLGIDVTEGAIAKDNASVVLGGQVYTAIESAKSGINAKLEEMQGVDNGILSRLDTVEGVASTNAGDIADLKAAVGEGGSVETQINNAISKYNTDTVVPALAEKVDLEAYNEHVAEIEAYVESNDAAVKKVSDDLAAEVLRATGEESRIENKVDDHIADAIRHITADERAAWNEAKADIDAFLANAGFDEEGKNVVDTLKELQEYLKSDGEAAGQLVNRVAALEAADEAMTTRVDGVEADYKAADQTLQGNINNVAADVEDLADTVSSMDAAYKAADVTLQENINALTKTVGDNKTAIEKTVADNKAAIEKTVADNKTACEQALAAAKTELQGYADQAEADALAAAKAYTDSVAGVYGSEGVEATGLRKEIAERDAAVLEAAKAYADSAAAGTWV